MSRAATKTGTRRSRALRHRLVERRIKHLQPGLPARQRAQLARDYLARGAW